MSTRCGCSSDGDPIVFGECRTCHPEPEAPRERPWEIVLGPDETEDR